MAKKKGPTPSRAVRLETRGRPGQIRPTVDRRRANRRRNIITAVVLTLILGGFAAGVVYTVTRPQTLPGLQTTRPAPETWPPELNDLTRRVSRSGLPPVGNEAFHKHTHLDVFIDGQEIEVPDFIGRTESFIAAMHTHNELGTAHMESDQPFETTLGAFFDVWGVRFTADCIGGYCVDEDNPLEVYVDGEKISGDPRVYVMEDLQEVAIVYGDPPAEIPATFDFSTDPSAGVPSATPTPPPSPTPEATPSPTS